MLSERFERLRSAGRFLTANNTSPRRVSIEFFYIGKVEVIVVLPINPFTFSTFKTGKHRAIKTNVLHRTMTACLLLHTYT